MILYQLLLKIQNRQVLHVLFLLKPGQQATVKNVYSGYWKWSTVISTTWVPCAEYSYYKIIFFLHLIEKETMERNYIGSFIIRWARRYDYLPAWPSSPCLRRGLVDLTTAWSIPCSSEHRLILPSYILTWSKQASDLRTKSSKSQDLSR